MLYAEKKPYRTCASVGATEERPKSPAKLPLQWSPSLRTWPIIEIRIDIHHRHCHGLEGPFEQSVYLWTCRIRKKKNDKIAREKRAAVLTGSRGVTERRRRRRISPWEQLLRFRHRRRRRPRRPRFGCNADGERRWVRERERENLACDATLSVTLSSSCRHTGRVVRSNRSSVCWSVGGYGLVVTTSTTFPQKIPL